MKSDLLKKVGHQFKIMCYVKEKLDVVNNVYNGHRNNDSVYFNRFLLFTAHVFYRSIVIDLCALFAKRSNDKNSFRRLYDNPLILSKLKLNRGKQIKLLIENHENDISKILKLRDGEYAHYDFSENAISFNFDDLNTLNHLFESGKKILEICGDNENVSFDLSEGDYSELLEKLVRGNVIKTEGGANYPCCKFNNNR